MKLVIQIPCLNEAEFLPATLAQLPRAVAGFDEVEWLVIDDGSEDGTAEVARANGVDHVVRFARNKGLASAFQAGIAHALSVGADVIVNTDADGQYPGDAIGRLTAPVVAGEADIVIGDRGVADVGEFSFFKKRFQRLGSRIVSAAAGTPIPDATSGFRAYGRAAAESVAIVNRYTYTVESIIQSAKLGLTIEAVPIERQDSVRPSRLFASTRSYVLRNALTILRVFAAYEPIRFFGTIGVVLGIGSVAAFLPWLVDAVVNGRTSGHLQSIVLGAVLAIAACLVFLLAVIADLIYAHRTISERMLRLQRASMWDQQPVDQQRSTAEPSADSSPEVVIEPRGSVQ